MIRLDRFLSEAGVGTRKEVKDLIKKKVIFVEGEPAKDPGMQIQETAIVTCKGVPVTLVREVYYLLHKPAGYVSSTNDNDGPSVLHLISKEDMKSDLFPCGRLDKDTEGFLLITNDGELSHRLLSPKKHVDKTYRAMIDGIVTEEDVVKFKDGLSIGEKKETLPADLKILSVDAEAKTSLIELTIAEGKFHQVKRMFEAVDKKVTYLKRITFGGLTLPEDLEKGAYRPLTEAELNILRSNG